MKCPHCNVGISEGFAVGQLATYPQQTLHDGRFVPAVVWHYHQQRCPECSEVIIKLQKTIPGKGTQLYPGYPGTPSSSRSVPVEVTAPFSDDFKEACFVLPISAKASAALSRRCLQAVLREKASTASKDLYDQIEEVTNTGRVPSHIAEDLHAVRVIGNFAAHPLKSKNTGEIVDVEPGEAEWNLDVLESLFDLYFVQPELSKKRKAALNQKLTDAGKPSV